MKRWILPLLVGIAVATGGLIYARHAASEDVERGLREAENRFVADFERALGEHDHLIDTLSARLRRIDDLKTAQEQVLRRARNTDHLAAARRYGVERSPTREDLNRLVESGALMRLEDNDFYWIQDLDLSVPYVTPSTAQALEEIGRRFHAALAERGLPPIRFNISSVLRTSESQQELRRINPNAARGVSAHEFGTTVDVVYHTYDLAPEVLGPGLQHSRLDSLMDEVRGRSLRGLAMVYWQELQGLLGRILIDMQQEGILLVTLEREQPVFHLTLARPLADE